MNKVYIITTLVLSSVIVSGQEKYILPELTREQKHQSMIMMFWGNLTPAISFAKSKGISAYELGTYYGNIFYEARANKEDDFMMEDYAEAVLMNWTFFLTKPESEIIIEIKTDSLLIYKVPASVMSFFGTEGQFGVTASEMLEMMNGSHEQISRLYGCTSIMKLDGEWILGTIKQR